MATRASSCSSSSSSSTDGFEPKEYDVFISFRGEDTRSNFTSHLRDNLRRNQIITYMDDKLNKGDEISPALSQAIDESCIAIIVFSENYAGSKWCLNELLKVVECRKKGQDVIPVFYNVDPSHVRKQRGSYQEAFTKHALDINSDQHKLKEWRQALSEAANLAGWDSRMCMDESKFIQEIVKDVMHKLDYKCLQLESKCPFGINENLKPIESLFRKFQIIGIWGMGGMGKTTIAKWLFDNHSSQYEGSYFMINIRERSGKQRQELHELRKDLVSNLLGEGERTTNVESAFVKRRLCRKRVCIVLDDVSTSKQLEYLLGEFQFFGSGSRIVITTRDKHVLTKGGVDAIHEVVGLDFQDSLQLFCLNAFKQNYPTLGYEELSERAIHYAKGLPLALEVLGAFLYSKSEDEWESALKKLKKIPNEEIQSVLRLSYEGLDDDESEIFLDVAFFWKGKHKESVISLLDIFDYHTTIGLRTLQDKALITINGGYIQMHDLIQEMGWEIVREESPKEPGRRSRLGDPREVYDVLSNNTGTDAVEGIILDMSQIRDLDLNVDTFRNMTKLRVLRFYWSFFGSYSTVHLPSGLHLFSNRLSYLKWWGYPSKSLPLTFCPRKLVKLSMRDSHVVKLWDGVQDLKNLKKIDLRGSKSLMELPDFSMASNLEGVDLSGCISLRHVHSSLLSLPSLVWLCLSGCENLKRFESETHLKSLEVLDLGGCISLEKFGVYSEEMRDLNLSDTRIEVLPSCIGLLSKLDVLDLGGLRIEILPCELSNIFDGLQSLTFLYLNQASYLTALPDNISILSSLKLLDLSGSCIECLPASIKQLNELEYLYLSECRRLRSLPELPQSIKYLKARNCTALETLVIPRISMEREFFWCDFDFSNCLRLNEHAMSSICEDTYSGLKGHPRYINIFARYSGTRVPEWFQNKRAKEDSISIELDPTSQILGFVFCFVSCPLYCDSPLYSSDNDDEKDFPPDSEIDNYKVPFDLTAEFDGTSVKFHGKILSQRGLNSHHVWLRFYDCCLLTSFHIWSRVKSLEFVAYAVDELTGEEIKIKECGILPLYAVGKKRAADTCHSGNETKMIKK